MRHISFDSLNRNRSSVFGSDNWSKGKKHNEIKNKTKHILVRVIDLVFVLLAGVQGSEYIGHIMQVVYIKTENSV